MKKYLMFLSVFVMSFIMSTGLAYGSEVDAIRNKTALYLLGEQEKALANAQTYTVEGYLGLYTNDNFILQEEMNMEATFYAAVNKSQGVFIDTNIYFPLEMLMEGGILEGMPVINNYQFVLNRDGAYIRQPNITDWELMADNAALGFDFAELMGMNDSSLLAYPQMDSLIDYMNSKYTYKKNAVVGGQEYYVISYEYDINEVLSAYRSFAENLYLDMEEDMYEGYTTEVMAVYDSISDLLGGVVQGETYINTDTFIADYSVFYMGMNLDMSSYGLPLSLDMELVGDYLIYDINSPIEIPTFE